MNKSKKATRVNVAKTRKSKKNPVRDTKQIIVDSNDPGYVNRVLVATPTTGNVRMEWVMARYGQVIPMNWSMVTYIEFMNSFVPMYFSVPDAQNIIVKETLEKDFEWLLLIEDDTILPPDGFIRFNKYMRDGDYPVVSGLYFSRAEPSEPLIFRGRGNSVYWKWKFGDLVMADGVPTGALLVHHSVLRELWNTSPEYVVNGIKTRRVFDNPAKVWYDPELQNFNTLTGTSDLLFCSRIINENVLEKAGWPKLAKEKFPFLVDTNIFARHIDRNTGEQYPKKL